MSNKRILIVEDDFDNTTLVRLLLERERFDVISASNGQQGLDLVQETQPDLIVLDLDMPVMDGWGMLKELQSKTVTQDIPIVIVTAHLMPDERGKVFKAGGQGYVLKPYHAHDLVSEIMRCL